MKYVAYLFFAASFAACVTPPEEPGTIFKITTAALWAQSQADSSRRLILAAQDKDFIHFAEKADVERIAKKFFKQEEDVIVLEVDSKKLVGRLVKEKNPGGQKEYFHLYDGWIPMDAIVSAQPFTQW